MNPGPVEGGAVRPHRKALSPVELLGQARPWHWIVLSVAILLVDYVTGPFIQFPLLFIVPVAVAAAGQGLVAGLAVAALLPLLHLSFYLIWGPPRFWRLEWVNAGVDILILVAFAALVERIVRQRRQIRVLEGLLPICSFCKRIRDESGEWRQLEPFIAARSHARFSHTFCEECGRAHYPAESVD